MTTKHYKGAMSACPRGKLVLHRRTTKAKTMYRRYRVPAMMRTSTLYSATSKAEEEKERECGWLNAEDYELLQVYQ